MVRVGRKKASSLSRPSLVASCVASAWLLCSFASSSVLPVDAFGRFADTQAVAQLVELGAKLGVGAVQVLRLREQLHVVVARHAVVFQNLYEGLQVGGVDDQQLVLVELHLNRPGRP